MLNDAYTLKSFEIVQKIGVGKYGTVYLAIEHNTSFQVALKIIPKNKINSNILYKQIRRQIQIQTRLKHFNICEMYAYFTDDNNIYMVLQYCPNGNLYFPVKMSQEKFSDRKIAIIMLQLLNGVAYLQERCIMHRDIKLQNILIDKDGNVKISDFGWCIHTFEGRHTFCGTMEYICPEMLENKKYGHQIDVYCLGIVMYQLYYEISPFIDQTQKETLQNIKQRVFNFNDQFRIAPLNAKKLISELIGNGSEYNRPKAKELLHHDYFKEFI